jgi:hypothetical protein
MGTKKEGREPKANPNEEKEVLRLAVLPFELWVCPHRDVSQAARSARRRSMLVVRKDSPDSEVSVPPLQEVEVRTARTVENSRVGDWLEGGEVWARANIGTVLPRDVRSSGDGLPGCAEIGKFPCR